MDSLVTHSHWISTPLKVVSAKSVLPNCRYNYCFNLHVNLELQCLGKHWCKLPFHISLQSTKDCAVSHKNTIGSESHWILYKESIRISHSCWWEGIIVIVFHQVSTVMMLICAKKYNILEEISARIGLFPCSNFVVFLGKQIMSTH